METRGFIGSATTAPQTAGLGPRHAPPRAAWHWPPRRVARALWATCIEPRIYFGGPSLLLVYVSHTVTTVGSPRSLRDLVQPRDGVRRRAHSGRRSRRTCLVIIAVAYALGTLLAVGGVTLSGWVKSAETGPKLCGGAPLLTVAAASPCRRCMPTLWHAQLPLSLVHTRGRKIDQHSPLRT